MVKRYGLLANMLVGIVRNANEKKIMEQLSLPSTIIQSQKTVGRNPDILVLQVESLDANIVNLKINGKYVMPFLSSFASRTVHYLNMLSFHGAGASADADFCVLNSLPPVVDNCTYKLTSYNYPNSIVKQLKTAGYTAIGLHGLPGYFFNRGPAFYSMGFDDYFDLDRSALPVNQWGAADKNFLDFLQNILDTLHHPWFVYAITLTSHTPFCYYKNCVSKLKFNELPNCMIHDYIESMVYVDSVLSLFIPRFMEKNPDAIILIFGDHSPGDFHSFGFNASIYKCSQGEVEFVPLMIYLKQQIPEVSNKIVSFLDVGPTILDLAKIAFQIHSTGASLLRNELLPDTIPFRNGKLTRSELMETISKQKAFFQRRVNAD